MKAEKKILGFKKKFGGKKKLLKRVLEIRKKDFQEKKTLEINFDLITYVFVFLILQFQVQSYHHFLKR